MGLAIFAVLALLFLLLAYLSLRTWEVLHVVAAVLLFFATCGLLMMAAATLKVRQQWQRQYFEAKVGLETALQERQRLVQGAYSGDQPILSVSQIRNEVRRTLADRGRVWRNLRLQDIGQGTITLDATNWGDLDCQRVGLESGEQLLEGEPLAPEAAVDENGQPIAPPPRPLGLQSQSVVYAFQEIPAATLPQPLQQALYEDSHLAADDVRGLCKVPGVYLGQFTVSNDPQADPSTITLTPAVAITEEQFNVLQNPDLTWALYEVMPVDSHEAFAGLTEQQITAIFLGQPGVPPEQTTRLVEPFTRDGKLATEQDPPERKWMRVRFIKPQVVEVDAQPIPLPDEPYDPSGRAVEANLLQGAPTTFQEGDEALVDFDTAEQWRVQGIVEPIEAVYRRDLRDYAGWFRELAGQSQLIAQELAAAQGDLAKLQNSIQKLRDQISFQTDQRQKFDMDKQGIERDRVAISTYHDQLAQQWTVLSQHLSRLYRANKQMAARKATLARATAD